MSLKAKIHLHFKMTFFKGQRKNDSVYAEHVQTFHFLITSFSYEFKEALLKCIAIELVSHIFSV